MKLPPRMKPNSFIIRVLTEGTDCYSIRVIPGGNGARSDEGDANTSRIYSLYVLKGSLNSEEEVEGESVSFSLGALASGARVDIH